MEHTKIEWEYSRNQRRHTGYTSGGYDRFYITSNAPESSKQGKHGYNLIRADINTLSRNSSGKLLSWGKTVKDLKIKAESLA